MSNVIPFDPAQQRAEATGCPPDGRRAMTRTVAALYVMPRGPYAGLEHPDFTLAWPRFDLPEPPHGTWQRTFCGGFVAQVSQAAYGHKARKMTWLYAYGVEPPPLERAVPIATALVSKCANHGADPTLPRLTAREAKATPPAFRDLLLSIARSTQPPAARADTPA